MWRVAVIILLSHSSKGLFMISKMREPVNGLTHLGGAIAALVGQVVLLIFAWNGLDKIISVLIYGISLILLFSASATYHLVQAGPRTIQMLRKFDHSAIYVLIAGTYTPICLIAFTGFFRWGLLTIIWSLAIIGILAKVFYINSPRWFSAGVYVIMGWLCVSAAGQMVTALSPWSLTWLLAGGAAYTLGAVIYATKIFNFMPGKFGYHEVWHIFVLAGAAAHFLSVFGIIYRF
jgi:hemolysin III